jgi:ATP/maltotriose-dependent transcriptional regulator MalT
VATELINEIESRSEELALVLDDYQMIETPSMDAASRT